MIFLVLMISKIFFIRYIKNRETKQQQDKPLMSGHFQPVCHGLQTVPLLYLTSMHHDPSSVITDPPCERPALAYHLTNNLPILLLPIRSVVQA